MPRAHVPVSYEHIILLLLEVLLGTESLCWNTAYPPALLAQNICHVIFSLVVPGSPFQQLSQGMSRSILPFSPPALSPSPRGLWGFSWWFCFPCC